MNTSSPPPVRSIDHIHVFVADRQAAERWYARVLGFTRIKAYEFWAADGGPLTIQNQEGSVHLALFERPPRSCRSTIALGVGAPEFAAWRAHLTRTLPQAPSFEDHALSVSLYFNDPDGNPYEITTSEYQAAKAALASGEVFRDAVAE